MILAKYIGVVPPLPRVLSKSFFVDRFREHEGTRLILFL